MDCRISITWDGGHLPTHLPENKQRVVAFCWSFLCLISLSHSPAGITEVSSSTGYYKICGLLLWTSGCTTTPPKIHVKLEVLTLTLNPFTQVLQTYVSSCNTPSKARFPDLVLRIILPVHLYNSRNGETEQSEALADTERSKSQSEMAAQKTASAPAQREMDTPHSTLTQVLIFPGPSRLWTAFPSKGLKSVCVWLKGKHSRINLTMKYFPLFWNGLTLSTTFKKLPFPAQPYISTHINNELDLTLTSCIFGRSPNKKKLSLRLVTKTLFSIVE